MVVCMVVCQVLWGNLALDDEHVMRYKARAYSAMVGMSLIGLVVVVIIKTFASGESAKIKYEVSLTEEGAGLFTLSRLVPLSITGAVATFTIAVNLTIRLVLTTLTRQVGCAHRDGAPCALAGRFVLDWGGGEGTGDTGDTGDHD